jgi:hypothetical protein
MSEKGSNSIPPSLIALAEELNQRGPGFAIKLISDAGLPSWELEIRRGGTWPGGEIEKVTEAAKKHGCKLERIDHKGAALLKVDSNS